MNTTVQLDETSQITQTISEFVSYTSLETIPENVLEHALMCIADACGIAFASHQFSFSASASNTIDYMDGHGEGVVIGSSKRYDYRDAALFNGLLIHGLDFDDTHSNSVVHATASTLPATLAASQLWENDPREFLTAYILGVEISARIGSISGGMGLPPGMKLPF